MKILLNGEQYEHNASGTLTALMNELDISSQAVAVMINNRIISRSDRASAPLAEGDQVEIVAFAPGG